MLKFAKKHWLYTLCIVLAGVTVWNVLDIFLQVTNKFSLVLLLSAVMNLVVVYANLHLKVSLENVKERLSKYE